MDILLGTGIGTFKLSDSHTSYGGYYSIVIADVNGDGKPDLIVNDISRVGVLLGNGDGTFRDLGAFSLGITSDSLVAGDVNGDHIPDLILSGTTFGTSVGVVEAYLGNGDGTFRAGPVETVNSKSACLSVAVADFNGDGKLDSVAGCGNVYLVPGSGDGSFGPPSQIAPAITIALTAADLNGDGRPDVVYQSGQSIDVLLNLGTGRFAPPEVYQTAMVGLKVITGDLNGDGVPDIVSCSGSASNQHGSPVYVLFGKGDGSFTAPKPVRTVNGLAVATGDYNGDGNTDIGVVRTGSLEVAFGNGRGAFLQPAISQFSAWQDGYIADTAEFNRDGLDDLITSATSGPYDINVAVALSKGDGTFEAPVMLPAGNGQLVLAARAGDVNGDGAPDILTINLETSGISLFLYPGSGDGTFGAPVLVGTYTQGALPYLYAARLADVNGDGKLDLIEGFTKSDVSGQVLQVFFGRGDGTF